jgi:hypothetical protein
MSARYAFSVGRDGSADAFYRAQSRTVRQFCAQHGINCALH